MKSQKSALDHYRTLELPYGAPLSEIQRAFRRLAKLHHPDRQSGLGDEGARFREIVIAYDYLKNYVPHQSEARNPHAEAYPDSELFSEAFRQMRARRIRIHPRRAPRDRSRRRAGDNGEPMRSARPRLFLVRPPSNDYYYIYIFYIGSIGFIIIMIIWNIISTIFGFDDPDPSPMPPAPAYTEEEKVKMLEIYEESTAKEAEKQLLFATD